MKVDFKRLTWENYPSEETPLNADNLNRLEEGVAGLYSDVHDIEQELDGGVGEYVADWLNEHVDPVGSAVVVDDTLSIEGAAADAKKTGDELSSLKEDLIPFPISPDNKYGTNGQLLRTKGNGKTEWGDVGLPTDEQTAEAVTAWLNDHPEATTSVEDHSLTYEKLVNGTLGFVTPEMYGAKGDGVTDDTEALKECIDSGNVVHLLGTYMISEGINLHGNLQIYGFGKGTIIKDPNTTVHFASLLYYDNANTLENVLIDGVQIVGLKHWTNQSLSGTNNDYGIRIKNAKGVQINNNNVSECGGCGIGLEGLNCIISQNTIIYTGSFSGNSPNYNFGIAYDGENFFISENKISGVIQGILSGINNKKAIISNNNISTNGQHGLYMEGGYDVTVESNLIHDCTLCGIKFQNQIDDSNFGNLSIANNIIKKCGAQGVLVADLSPNKTRISNVVINGNNIININRGIDVNYIDSMQISNNIIKGANDSMYYGVLVVSSSDTKICDNLIENTITGYSTGGIAICEIKSDLLSHDVALKNNVLKNTTGIKFPYNYTIENIVVDGNTVVDGLSTADIKFDYAKTSENAIVCNNVFPRGAALATGATIKRCFNNLGILYRDAFTLDLVNDTRVSVLSQNCYLKGDSIFLNVDFTLLARGSATTVFSATISDLMLSKDVVYTYYPFSDDLELRISYTGTVLSIILVSGTANKNYHLSLVI